MASCLRPKIVPVKSSFFEVAHAHPANQFWRERFRINTPTQSNLVVMSCGKCINCLKKRQDQFVVRIQAECKKSPLVHFVTLTYNEDTIPLSQSLWRVDVNTGEMMLEYSPSFVDESNLAEFREKLRNIRPGHCARYYEFEAFNGMRFGDFKYVVRVTPSVKREDVRLWLKRCRVKYEREFGCKLPDFKYMMVPEYGFKSCRPHYHILFFGLSKEDVDYLTSNWDFGFTLTKPIKAYNNDGSNAHALVARYVSKYMTKGRFECDSVKDGCSEKPRVCQSIKIGESILDEVRDYVYCRDMVPAYDLDYPERTLSSEQIQKLVSEIPKRLSYAVDDKYRYPLPRCIVEKLFKERIVYKDDHQKSKVLLRPRKIWSLVQKALLAESVKAYNREFSEFCASHSLGETPEAFAAFKVYSEANSSFQDKSGEKSFLSTYVKSKL